MHLSGSIVMVTGGASGLGESVVRQAVSAGAAGVGIIDVNADRGSALAAELGASAHFARADVSSSADVEAAVTSVVERFGRLDVAVCCAGIPGASRTIDKTGKPVEMDYWRKVIEVNLIGTYDTVRQAASAMSRNEPNADGERGAIVLTASVAAFDGQTGQTSYSASKGGIVGMTLPLARDLAPAGIRVNTIAPGLIRTPIYDFAPPEFLEALARNPVFPMRLGRPEEFAHLAQAVIENTYMNGEVIRLDAAVRLPPK
jgi:3-hydroxyacyl-CoA dehydrogenase / 3-hydroxy-2-methylbutyryl-CoA dehydrogenase